LFFPSSHVMCCEIGPNKLSPWQSGPVYIIIPLTKTNLTWKQTRERIFPLSTCFSSLPSLHLHKNYHFGEKFKVLCRRKQCRVTFITNHSLMKSDCGEKAVKVNKPGKTYLLKFKYLYSSLKLKISLQSLTLMSLALPLHTNFQIASFFRLFWKTQQREIIVKQTTRLQQGIRFWISDYFHFRIPDFFFFCFFNLCWFCFLITSFFFFCMCNQRLLFMNLRKKVCLSYLKSLIFFNHMFIRICFYHLVNNPYFLGVVSEI
jgi:hypothetical protein